jgi:hypothetical protein
MAHNGGSDPMAKVYLIEDANHATFYGTKREARDSQRRAEEPERIQTIDAAQQCNGMLGTIREMENQIIDLTISLKGIINVAPMDLLKETREGKEALDLMRKIDPDFLESCGL